MPKPNKEIKPHAYCPDCGYSDHIDEFDKESTEDKIILQCTECGSIFNPDFSKSENDSIAGTVATLAGAHSLEYVLDSSFYRLNDVECTDCEEASINNLTLKSLKLPFDGSDQRIADIKCESCSHNFEIQFMNHY